jgi:hypothetical protein
MTYGTHLVPNSALTKRHVAWVRNYIDDTTIRLGAMAWESYNVFTNQSPEPIPEQSSVPPEPEDLPPLDRRCAFLRLLQHSLATDHLLISIPATLVPGNMDLQAMIFNHQVHRGGRTDAISFTSKHHQLTHTAGFVAVNHPAGPSTSYVPDPNVPLVRQALPANSDTEIPNERHTKRSHEDLSDTSDSDSDQHATILLVHLSNQIRRYRRESRRQHREILEAIRDLRGRTE